MGLKVAWLSDDLASVRKLHTRMIFGNWLWPSRRRQVFCAPSTSLNTMASAVLFERHPFERIVLCRTVAKVLSIGFDVRRCFQCSAGKS